MDTITAIPWFAWIAIVGIVVGGLRTSTSTFTGRGQWSPGEWCTSTGADRVLHVRWSLYGKAYGCGETGRAQYHAQVLTTRGRRLG